MPHYKLINVYAQIILERKNLNIQQTLKNKLTTNYQGNER